MFRFLSFLLILAGLAATAYGGYRYMESEKQSASAPSVNSDMAPGFEASESSSVDKSMMPTLEGKPGAASRSLSLPNADFADEDILVPESVATDFLSSLQTVPIAHETPTRAQFGRPFEVTVAIDATGDSTAADALPGRGDIVEGTAQISADVQATLSGDQFEIESVTPLIQTVSPITENVWRWSVTPLEAGSHPLTIELFALNGDRAMPVRTFRDDVEVNVSRIGQVIATANSFSPIAVVIGGIGSLLAGLLGFLRLFRRG